MRARDYMKKQYMKCKKKLSRKYIYVQLQIAIYLKSLLDRLFWNKWQKIIVFVSAHVTLPCHHHGRHLVTVFHWPAMISIFVRKQKSE